MTAEQLEELLGKVTQGPWLAWQPRGDESVPVRTDGLGITIAYVHQGAITNAKTNARLIALAPSLARRVLAAEKLVEALEWLAYGKGKPVSASDAITAYRDASK